MLLEVDFSTDLGINFEISEDTKSLIADAIVTQIKDRTQAGKPLGTGGKFIKYSEAYAAKKGVGINDVDLTLSEDMLNALVVDDIQDDTIQIMFDNDEVIARAFNHHTGDTLPKRPFFGIQKNELANIKREASTLIARDRAQAAAIDASISEGVDFG